MTTITKEDREDLERWNDLLALLGDNRWYVERNTVSLQEHAKAAINDASSRGNVCITHADTPYPELIVNLPDILAALNRAVAAYDALVVENQCMADALVSISDEALIVMQDDTDSRLAYLNAGWVHRTIKEALITPQQEERSASPASMPISEEALTEKTKP